MSNNPQTDRIPLGHSVRYAVRGLPEVPNQYGPGTLEPREITLTYRAAPDSQLGRVHAYVAGRIWVNGAELPLLPGGLYGQHYDDGLDGWPEWLAEEARLHDPAVLPAVPVPPTTHATDSPSRRAGLRDQLRRAVCEAEGFAWDSDMLEPDEYGEHADVVLAVLYREWPWLRAEAEDAEPVQPTTRGSNRAALRDRVAEALYRHEWPHKQIWQQALSMDRETFEAMADAVLTVLPPPADRAAVLREAADFVGNDDDCDCGGCDTCHPRKLAAELRRMADEAQQQPDTETRPMLARPAVWAAKRQDATVDPAMCPRCEGDNQEAFQLCAKCAQAKQPVPGPGRVADEEPGETRQACACGQDGCEYCDVAEEPGS